MPTSSADYTLVHPRMWDMLDFAIRKFRILYAIPYSLNLKQKKIELLSGRTAKVLRIRTQLCFCGLLLFTFMCWGILAWGSTGRTTFNRKNIEYQHILILMFMSVIPAAVLGASYLMAFTPCVAAVILKQIAKFEIALTGINNNIRKL